jgi:hypothetical protein
MRRSGTGKRTIAKDIEKLSSIGLGRNARVACAALSESMWSFSGALSAIAAEVSIIFSS